MESLAIIIALAGMGAFGIGAFVMFWIGVFVVTLTMAAIIAFVEILLGIFFNTTEQA